MYTWIGTAGNGSFVILFVRRTSWIINITCDAQSVCIYFTGTINIYTQYTKKKERNKNMDHAGCFSIIPRYLVHKIGLPVIYKLSAVYPWCWNAYYSRCHFVLIICPQWVHKLSSRCLRPFKYLKDKQRLTSQKSPTMATYDQSHNSARLVSSTQIKLIGKDRKRHELCDPANCTRCLRMRSACPEILIHQPERSENRKREPLKFTSYSSGRRSIGK